MHPFVRDDFCAFLFTFTISSRESGLELYSYRPVVTAAADGRNGGYRKATGPYWVYAFVSIP